MKVWYILMSFPSSTETFAANEVRTLARLGLEISVHSLRGPWADAERMLRERGLADLEVTHGTVRNILRGLLVSFARPLRTVRLAAWIVRHSGGRPVHLVKGLALLPRTLELFDRVHRDRPDVVHIYWGHYPAIFGWLVLEYAPQVVVSLSLSAYDLLRDFPGSIAVARRAHLVSTWAGVNVSAIARRGLPPEVVHVAWQGVDLDNVKDRRFLKVPRRVVSTGRLVSEKGMDDVVRAFARVAAEHPDASLVILGEGPGRRRLEELAATLGVGEAITFRGHVPHHEVFEELAQAEVFLFLSRYVGDRLPNVVKEAMASRCLVVTTATLGIEELLEDGVHGWVVPFDGWEQAAERAIEAFTEPEVARIMAAAAQRHVLENFDLLRLMEKMVRRWEQCGAPRRALSPDGLHSHISTLETTST